MYIYIVVGSVVVGVVAVNPLEACGLDVIEAIFLMAVAHCLMIDAQVWFFLLTKYADYPYRLVQCCVPQTRGHTPTREDVSDELQKKPPCCYDPDLTGKAGHFMTLPLYRLLPPVL